MPPDQLQQLDQRLSVLERQLSTHHHTGLGDTRVNLRDIFGAIEVTSTAPAGKPTRIGDQVKIYTNGATLRLYWYDTVAGAWHYVTATA